MSRRASAGRKHAATHSPDKRKRRPTAARPRVNVLAVHVPASGSKRSLGERLAARRPRAMPIVPDEIRRRFLIERNIYYFPRGARAFLDRGDQLTTRRENARLIKSLVSIAQARGWRAVTIAGSARFKERMWIALELAGLTVQGSAPDRRTQAKLVRARARQSASLSQPPLPLAPLSTIPEAGAQATARQAPQAASGPGEWRGRLVSHGPAPFQHDPANRPSYVLTLQTRSGERALWGVDLKRALRASLSHPAPGDEVVVRRVGQEAVMAQAARDERRPTPRTFRRNRYVIETHEFLEARADLARMVRDPSVSARRATEHYPELTSTYLQLQLARLAAQRLQHQEDRTYFVAFVRRALATAIARGEPLRRLSVRTRTHPDRPKKIADPLRE